MFAKIENHEKLENLLTLSALRDFPSELGSFAWENPKNGNFAPFSALLKRLHGFVHS